MQPKDVSGSVRGVLRSHCFPIAKPVNMSNISNKAGKKGGTKDPRNGKEGERERQMEQTVKSFRGILHFNKI